MTARTEQPKTITVRVPMTFSVRGGRKTVVTPAAPTSEKRADSALVVALARAYRWRQLIESGEFASITELAKTKSVNQSYACRLLRLTLLAPALVTQFLNGAGHRTSLLKDLMKPLPTSWNEQPNWLEAIRSK